MPHSIKSVRIPVESHGLHSHPFNFPYFGTSRFMECFPVYVEHLRKGESAHPKGAFFSRLNPTRGAAFVTGRYSFKAFFVPNTMVFSPYYHVDQGLPYKLADGSFFTFGTQPYTNHGILSRAFVNTQISAPYVEEVTNTALPYDIVYHIATNNVKYYKVTSLGARLLKVLNGLGISPQWIYGSNEPINLFSCFAYIRAYLDYVFPSQYVGTKSYQDIDKAILLETSDYNNIGAIQRLLYALSRCSTIFYDRSMYDYAWDNPTGPSDASLSNPISVTDQDYAGTPTWNSADANIIASKALTGGDSNVPNNSPSIQNPSRASADSEFSGRITKFALNALNSIANVMRRRSLGGSRLVDAFLASRGVHLGHIESNTCYYLGQKNFEIQLDPVENNSDTNLGELAGKGVAFSDPNKPMSFDCKADHDGTFVIMCCVVPDCDLPVYNDPFNSKVYQMDFYHPAFDKLGVEGVRQIHVVNFMNGGSNLKIDDKLFAFLNRYYADIAPRPRLTGDFRLKTRGADSLQELHSFRLFDSTLLDANNGVYHSLGFIDGSSDLDQYQRLFYDSTVDNFIVYIRWFGNVKKEKLPLGDSFDWSDDEDNRKVTIQNQGSKF